MPRSEQQSIARVRIEALAPHLAEAEFALQLGEAGLQLAEQGAQASGLVRVVFVEDAAEQLGLLWGGCGAVNLD